MKFRSILISAMIGAAFSMTAFGEAQQRYDFRSSAAYRDLSETDRQKLETVYRDFVLIWGALDMFCDDHNGQVPQTLDELVPEYLRELPRDPFSTRDPAAKDPSPYGKSLDGWGYHYRAGSPGNRAWVISSVGLPDFPFLAERGNVGLYVCKGTWISGVNPAISRD